MTFYEILKKGLPHVVCIEKNYILNTKTYFYGYANNFHKEFFHEDLTEFETQRFLNMIDNYFIDYEDKNILVYTEKNNKFIKMKKKCKENGILAVKKLTI